MSSRRKWLKDQIGEWGTWVFLTLTIDQKGTKTGRQWSGPEEAYHEVSDNRYVAKLMKVLGVKRWIKKLELQENGWPHWHVIMDREADIHVIRKWWVDIWKLGWSIDIEKSRESEALGGYLATYVTANNDELPQWVRNLGRVRWLETSRETVIGYREWLDGMRRESVEKHAARGDIIVTPKRRTIGEALDQCSRESIILAPVLGEDGFERWAYLGSLPVSTRTVKRLLDRLNLDYEVEYAFTVEAWLKEPWEDATGKQRLRCVLDQEGRPMAQTERRSGERGVWLSRWVVDTVRAFCGLPGQRDEARRDPCSVEIIAGSSGGLTLPSRCLPAARRIGIEDVRRADSNCSPASSRGRPPLLGSRDDFGPARSMTGRGKQCAS